MNLNNKVAVRIKEIREQKNLKQAEVAKALDSSPSAYSRIENGEIQITLAILEKLSLVFGITYDEFLETKNTHINHITNSQIGHNGSGTINVNINADDLIKLLDSLKK